MYAVMVPSGCCCQTAWRWCCMVISGGCGQTAEYIQRWDGPVDDQDLCWYAVESEDAMPLTHGPVLDT